MEDVNMLLGALKEFKEATVTSLEKMDDKITNILIQTTKTNGRVNTIETSVSDHEDKIEKLTGKAKFNSGRDWAIKTGFVVGGGLLLALIKIIFHI